MNTEPTINNRLAECLRQRHPEWRDDAVVSEQTGVLLDEPLKKPDVLIRSGAPVIVEAEIAPASTVDHDAIERLNRSVEGATLPVEAAIALIYPGRFRDTVRESDLDAALSDADDLAWRIFFTSETGTPSRFPTSGAIRGRVDDLAAAIETLTISPRHIEEAADTLARAVAEASGILTGLSDGCRQQIGDFLHQAPDPQTMRMASAVIADAFLCQTAIAEGCSTPNIDATRTRGTSRGLNKRHVLDVWHEILAVNYYPVFSLASRVLTAVPDNKAGAVCDRLAAAAQDLAAAGAVEVQDLAGQMLGRLIADRKFLATFYTRPASAALLAELAALRLEIDWSDPEAVAGLRIADLACGTGALLSAAYRRVAARHRRRGKDPARVHKEMMRQSLIGADVMPAAAHLTTMMLSAAHPAKPFDACEIHVVPYGLTSAGRDLLEAGREEDLEVKHVRLGSLELMAKDQTGSLIGQESRRLAGREGSVREDDTAFEFSAGSVDLMIMNPPFTRPTGHESGKVGVPVPSFAGLSTSPSAQKKMSQRLKRFRPPHGSAGHGNAGLASDFIDLAHNKLRPGGVLALILPAQIVAGESWTSARKLLRDHYSDIVIVTIAAADSSTSRAFSADTGMAEAIIVATKNTDTLTMDKSGTDTATYAVLHHRPTSLLEALETSRAIQSVRGQPGPQPLRVGDNKIGWLTEADFEPEARGHPAGVHSPDVADTARSLSTGENLRLPRVRAQALRTVALRTLGNRGPYHLDINGEPPGPGKPPRGPFDIGTIVRPKHAQASWPVLWAHEHEHETKMTVLPDFDGAPRHGQLSAARSLWNGTSAAAGATRLHINRDFQVNSQPLGACLTSRDALGGRAWPSFGATPANESDRLLWEKALCAWLNTTPGLIARWWVSSRQQKGRANLSITTIGLIPVPDLARIPHDQLQRLAASFDDHADKDLLPANEAWHDPVRQSLDESVLCAALDLPSIILGPLETLRQQWSSEPSVHGGKRTRPV